jgi:hypothetical protein
MQMFVCVRARDVRPTLVQVTRKFACTNWFGSGRVGSKISPLSMARVGSEKSDPPSTLTPTVGLRDYTV